MKAELKAEPFLEMLRSVAFVRRVRLKESFAASQHSDAALAVYAGTERFDFDVEFKRSYLDKSTLAMLSVLARNSRRPLMLFARYVPRPSAEFLIAAGIQFVDEAGNIHLKLGQKRSHTLLGQTEPPRTTTERASSAAYLQMLFAQAANPNLLDQTVRDIAKQAGISKSKAAELRQQLMQTPPSRIDKKSSGPGEEALLVGYSNILRPKLLHGRFRSPDSSPGDFLERLQPVAEDVGARWSMTGGPGAFVLQGFWRGEDTPLFIETWTPEIRKKLRLLPDREGPIIMLKAFGELPFWTGSSERKPVAHPWLIYAELMRSEDPRAHEAARELRREYLQR